MILRYRLRWVKDYYDAISTHQISLPTPVMAGVRTPQRQFSSCVLIETDDSLDSHQCNCKFNCKVCFAKSRHWYQRR